MIANSTCPFFILNQKSVTFHYAFTILILIIQSTNKLKLPKAQTSQVNIFYLSQFFFWTRNNNWTNSSIAMQVPFVRLIIQEADSGLVKLVVMTNVFFNKQQNETKIKPFIFVKYIKSRFFSNSWVSVFIVHEKPEDLSLQMEQSRKIWCSFQKNIWFTSREFVMVKWV